MDKNARRIREKQLEVIMEDKIEVGEYVRDKEGNITKIINTLSLFKDIELYLGEDGYQYSDNSIVKHSRNIIDLIEVGDYVNGESVREPIDNGIWAYGVCEGIEQFKRTYGDIKSIVTKEKFAQVQYIVGEQ